MSNVSRVGKIKSLLHDSKKKFTNSGIGYAMCELGDNMGHGDHTKLGIFKVSEEEYTNTYAFAFNKTIKRQNFDNLSTLCVDDKKHADKGNISQYGEGQTSLLIMAE